MSTVLLPAALGIFARAPNTELYVRPLARALQSEIFMPSDVTTPCRLEAVFGRIGQGGGASISCNCVSLTPAEKIRAQSHIESEAW